MFTRTARYYDRFYAFKDYAGEAARIADIILGADPGARTLLDVGCGTGAHDAYLAERFSVDGVDLQPELVEIARAKVPSARFIVGDMREMDLGRTYDAVICMFGAIAYARDPAGMTQTLCCMAAHLAPEGVVIVEPFIRPENWRTGMVHMQTVDEPELKLCRLNTSDRQGDLAVLRFHYLIGTPEGVEHAEEEHVLGLFTVEQMLSAFTAAGLTAEHREGDGWARGLYVARPA